MKFVALLSGGKDSVYNVLECVRLGHELVAIANLCPSDAETEELDSHCFQTVGHRTIEALGVCLDVPVYRKKTEGRALGRDVWYSRKVGDEVEDLYRLLEGVLEIEGADVRGVAVGAILSNYQRERVEDVCMRLGLEPLSFLWRRQGRGLLREMISSGLDARICKVASMGMRVSWLGCGLGEKEEDLLRLEEEYGVHCLGEGGELETIVLGGLEELFHGKKIALEGVDTVVLSDDGFAPVAHLTIGGARVEGGEGLRVVNFVEDKHFVEEEEKKETTKKHFVEEDEKKEITKTHFVEEDEKKETTKKCFVEEEEEEKKKETAKKYCRFVESGEDMEEVMRKLVDGGCEMENAVFVRLCIPRMSDFGALNEVYKTFLGLQAPSRACVQTGGSKIGVEVFTVDSGAAKESRSVLHVRSRSKWAPQCIGPYAQANSVNGLIFLAGQIGLEPASMTLVDDASTQWKMAVANTRRVLHAVSSNPGCVLGGTVWLRSGYDVEDVWTLVQRALEEDHTDPIFEQGPQGRRSREGDVSVLVVECEALPRGADVEFEWIACEAKHAERITGDNTYTTATLPRPDTSPASIHCLPLEPGSESATVQTISRILPSTHLSASIRLYAPHSLLPSILPALQSHWPSHLPQISIAPSTIRHPPSPAVIQILQF